MEGWSLTSLNELKLVETQAQDVPKGFCKVRIEMAGISSSDFDIVKGKDSVQYPIFIGNKAIGTIAEIAEDESLKKGTRVVLAPFIPCMDCVNCNSENYDDCLDFKAAGQEADGYLQDFVTLPISCVFELPPNVTNEQALFIPYIAMALSIFDKINYETGSYIGIGSATILGNILAQICLYYHTVPVVFDKYQSLLDNIKKVGVYFTFLNDETTFKKIFQITSGKLIDALVYIRKTNLLIQDAFTYLKEDGEMVIPAVASIDSKNVSIPLSEVLDRGIKVLPVPYTNDYMMKAINLLVNHSINIDPLLEKEAISFAEVGGLLTFVNEELIKNPSLMKIVKF